MAVKILMPALSPTMKVGNLAKWLKKEGDTIKPGDVIAEIETDKAVMEVEAADAGTVGKILVPEKTNGVKVNELIAVLLEKGESIKDAEMLIKAHAESISTLATQSGDNQPVKPAPAAPSSTQEQPVVNAPIIQGNHARIFATPLAKRLAEERGIDLARVPGSGPRGRIIKEDILNFQGHANTGRVSRNPQEYRALPLTQMRRAIATRLQESKSQIPHYYLTVDCDITELNKLRTYLNSRAKNVNGIPEYKISMNDLVIKAIAVALAKVPQANAGWIDETIVYYNNVDVSVAVATPEGLITPIIQNADQKTFIQISQEMKELSRKAKDNQLKPHEFMGGSFTVSNLGMYGIREFQAIINPPQACILAVGMAEERPIVKNGSIQASAIMTISISCDHRVIDGAVAAQLMQAFKMHIEQPVIMFL